MSEFTFLVKTEVPQNCFLSEALYWRAFGRIPQEIRDDEGNPWRDSDIIFDDYLAPLPDGEQLSDDECLFADLPLDPRMQALLTDRPSFDVEHYEKMLGIVSNFDPADRDMSGPYSLAAVKADLEEARKYHAEVADWLPHLREYLDQFQSEICLDLRRGNLTATGRMLPNPAIDDALDALGKDQWFDTIEPKAIPQDAWVSSDVDWSGSAILGRSASFIWIQINVAEMLRRYPPTIIAKPDQLIVAGATFAFSSLPPSSRDTISKRGRPSLPWDSFHVEVARLYKTGDMPGKKEAAIALLQDWFLQQHHKPASRSAIGHKLKPYFDTLGRK